MRKLIVAAFVMAALVSLRLASQVKAADAPTTTPSTMPSTMPS